MEENEVLIDITIEADEALKRNVELKAQIEALRKEQSALIASQKDVTKATAEGAAQVVQNEAKLKTLNMQYAANGRVLAAVASETTEVSGAYAALNKQAAEAAVRAKDLAVAYGANSAPAKQAAQEAKALSDQLKQADAATGQHQRNVGNYPQVFDLSNTSIGRFQAMLQSFGGTATSVAGMAGNAFNAIKMQAIALGKAFLTPPIGLIVIVLSAIVLAVTKVVQAFKKNDEASTNLQRAMSALKPIMEGINFIFDKLALVISKIVLGYAKFVSAIASAIPAFKNAAAAADALVVSQDKLEETQRQYTINQAKRNVDIAKLTNEALNTQKYSTEQRLAMLRQANELERLNLEDDKKIKAEQLRILIATAKQEKDTSDETANKIAAARAAMYQAEEAYYTGTRRLQSKMVAAEKEMQAEAEKNAAEAERKRKEREDRRKKQQEEAERKAKEKEDARLKKLKDDADAALAVLDYELKLKKLKYDEANAGIVLSDKQAHEEKIQSIIDANAAELERQRILLEQKQITQKEYDDAVILSNQERNTAIAVADANFEAAEQKRKDDAKAVEAQRIKDAQAIEEQAEYELRKAKADSQFEFERMEAQRNYDAQIAEAKKVGADTTAITELYAIAQTEIKRRETENSLGLASGFAGNIATIFGKNTKVGKMAASAQIAIDTYKGAMAAYSSLAAIPVVGVGLGIAAAAAVGITGAKAIKDVWNVKSGLPGDTGGSGGSAPKVNIKQTSSAGTASAVAGSLVSRQSGSTQAAMTQQAVANALAAQPMQPVLVTSNLTTVLNNEVQVKSNNSL